MEEYIIREANELDIPVIGGFNYNLAKETEHIELNQDVLYKGVSAIVKDQSKGKYFVCESKGRLVGQLMITKEWSDWRNGEFWWIQSVYVDREFRRKGVFKELYRYVEETAAQDERICGIRLYVEKENTAAQNTYKALGMWETYYRLYETSKVKL